MRADFSKQAYRPNRGNSHAPKRHTNERPDYFAAGDEAKSGHESEEEPAGFLSARRVTMCRNGPSHLRVKLRPHAPGQKTRERQAAKGRQGRRTVTSLFVTSEARMFLKTKDRF